MPSIEKVEWKFKPTQKGIEKRLARVQKFFDKIQNNATIRSIDFFIDFLSIPDKASFERKKKDVAKVAEPKSVVEVRHFKGKTAVGISREKMAEAKNLHMFCDAFQRLYSELMEANASTKQSMEQLAAALSNEAEIYKRIASACTTIKANSIMNVVFGDKRRVH